PATTTCLATSPSVEAARAEEGKNGLAHCIGRHGRAADTSEGQGGATYQTVRAALRGCPSPTANQTVRPDSRGPGKAAGGVLTAKQAPHGPGTAPALGLRAGRGRRHHSTADR